MESIRRMLWGTISNYLCCSISKCTFYELYNSTRHKLWSKESEALTHLPQPCHISACIYREIMQVKKSAIHCCLLTKNSHTVLYPYKSLTKLPGSAIESQSMVNRLWQSKRVQSLIMRISRESHILLRQNFKAIPFWDY